MGKVFENGALLSSNGLSLELIYYTETEVPNSRDYTNVTIYDGKKFSDFILIQIEIAIGGRIVTWTFTPYILNNKSGYYMHNNYDYSTSYDTFRLSVKAIKSDTKIGISAVGGDPTVWIYGIK